MDPLLMRSPKPDVTNSNPKSTKPRLSYHIAAEEYYIVRYRESIPEQMADSSAALSVDLMDLMDLMSAGL
jgi:hypothetical protein